MSDSWLVELTETTLVVRPRPGLTWLDVPGWLWAPVEQPAQAHTATRTRTTFKARTGRDGTSEMPITDNQTAGPVKTAALRLLSGGETTTIMTLGGHTPTL